MQPLSKIPRLCYFSTSLFVSSSRSRSHRFTLSRGYANATTGNNKFDIETDLLIVGSGAAGQVAAIRAHHHGLKPLIIEKSTKLGGASAYSGGALWIPNNHVSRAAGISDSHENALKYMEAVIKEGAPESSRERKLAFLDNGPKMVKWLEELGFRWRASVGYPDYHPGSPGASTRGRAIEGAVFNTKKLGDWEDFVLTRPGSTVPVVYTNEAPYMMRMLASMKEFWRTFGILAFRTLGRRILGPNPATIGRSLVSHLLFLNKERETEIWRNSPLIELIKGDDGGLIGAIVNKEGNGIRVRAKSGVLLAAGGFARNRQMREKYGPKPASIEWTSVPPGDNGDAINAGMRIGAATALMDDSWWGPTMIHNGLPGFDISARSLPHGIIVDSSGTRFMNESQSHVDAGHLQYARHKQIDAIPAYLVIDNNHRQRYFLGSLPPRNTPDSAFKSGFLVKGETIEELAEKLGIDAINLSATIERFNKFAQTGVDEDFGRGGNAHDNFSNDPKVKPNPNLGALSPGSTLGPATTFAYIAVDHIASLRHGRQ